MAGEHMETNGGVTQQSREIEYGSNHRALSIAQGALRHALNVYEEALDSFNRSLESTLVGAEITTTNCVVRRRRNLVIRMTEWEEGLIRIEGDTSMRISEVSAHNRPRSEYPAIPSVWVTAEVKDGDYAMYDVGFWLHETEWKFKQETPEE